MLEYTLAIIIIIGTLISAFIATKIPLLGFAVILINLLMCVDLASTGTVIMGYEVVGGVVTTVTQTFAEFKLVTVTVILLNIAGTIYGAYEALK